MSAAEEFRALLIASADWTALDQIERPKDVPDRYLEAKAKARAVALRAAGGLAWAQRAGEMFDPGAVLRELGWADPQWVADVQEHAREALAGFDRWGDTQGMIDTLRALAAAYGRESAPTTGQGPEVKP